MTKIDLKQLHSETMLTDLTDQELLVTGGKYDDKVNGGAGNDRISTGKGRDFLNGGSGADTLNGGSGADTYVYDPKDTVVFGPGDKFQYR
jgi:Ca2+-binding RTX toxin-like protein